MSKAKYQKKYDVDADHKPGGAKSDLGQWIGVEIECFIPFRSFRVDGEDLSADDTANDKLAALIRRNKIPYVNVKGDGSISSPDSGEYYECEITIMFNRKNKKPLRDLCRLLKSLRTQVNRSCGLHVHLDCRDVEDTYDTEMHRRQWSDPLPPGVWQRGRNLEKCLPLMLKMVARSRRNNSYCSPQMSANRTAINLGAFNRHRTIEVRLHQGTANYAKISNWIDLLYRASRSKKTEFGRVETPEQLKQYLGRVPKALVAYTEKRMKDLEPAA